VRGWSALLAHIWCWWTLFRTPKIGEKEEEEEEKKIGSWRREILYETPDEPSPNV